MHARTWRPGSKGRRGRRLNLGIVPEMPQATSDKRLRQWAGNFSHLAALKVIEQPSHHDLAHTLLAYWRKL